VTVATLVREARRTAGLTQAQLAERMGTTQSAVARLETGGANPRVATLDRALRAAGHSLILDTLPSSHGVDEAQIEAQLRLSPAERLEAHLRAHRNLGQGLGITRPQP
jgi:transcriptional regulator with XRE-family HTH domain